MDRFPLQYPSARICRESLEKYAISHVQGSLTYFSLTFARKTRDHTVGSQQRALRCHILISSSLRIRVIYAL